MKSNKAFTLIELLVVVLIIGILAAIAVPKYQKAVAKSHYTFIQNITKAIYEAQQAYYLANGKYTENFDDLDIDIKSGCGKLKCFFDWGFCSMYPEDPQISCSYGTYNMDRISLSFNLKTGKRRCIASSATGTNTNVYDIVCKQETGKNSDNEGSSRYYSYQ